RYKYKSELLNRRPDWPSILSKLFLPEVFNECIPNKLQEKRPIRVLSLFDGISTGKVVLDKLNIEIDLYFASEIDEDAINVSKLNFGDSIVRFKDIRQIDENLIKSILPIDLVIGGSPCNELSAVNPNRKGIYDLTGTGPLFFEFFRILETVRRNQPDHCILWMFENVTSMNRETKEIIDRFFGCNPAVWDAYHFSPQHRPRYFWGNIPGMHYPPSNYRKMDGLSLELKDSILKNFNREAKVSKIRTITTVSNSLTIKSRDKEPPILMNGVNSNIWVTELE
ncbi:MAG: DNA (cytosine-5)-methyltransferase 3A, partial [Paramarteilia canceri]